MHMRRHQGPAYRSAIYVLSRASCQETAQTSPRQHRHPHADHHQPCRRRCHYRLVSSTIPGLPPLSTQHRCIIGDKMSLNLALDPHIDLRPSGANGL
ncbi:hypothetical protein CMEL01_06831 [Colletotrichum melonis]|uniref:Uncharacterized protein n=1 Tax=Colletotrichum melonis TaxID=1209925 RepID=A0AAI9XJB6_9PEZI|nr:hypothetical protein CMEL01_06831 [Colletotrichum melonis]